MDNKVDSHTRWGVVFRHYLHHKLWDYACANLLAKDYNGDWLFRIGSSLQLLATGSYSTACNWVVHVMAWQEARIGKLLRAVHHCLLDMSYLRGSQRLSEVPTSGSLWDSSCLEGNDVQPWAVPQSLPPAKPLHDNLHVRQAWCLKCI